MGNKEFSTSLGGISEKKRKKVMRDGSACEVLATQTPGLEFRFSLAM